MVLEITEEEKEKIAEMRQILLKEHENGTLECTEFDLDNRIRSNEKLPAKFLKRNGGKVEPTLDMLRKTLKFCKDRNIPGLKAQDFPQEYFEIGWLYPYKNDREGNPVIHVRVKMHKKMDEFNPVVENYFLYVVNTAEVETNADGLAFVFDARESGLAHVDWHLIKFLITSWLNYYPGINYILVYELPWALQFVWKIVKGWLPEEMRDKIKFGKKDEIFEYIDKDCLPVHYGGTCLDEFRVAPAGCKPVRQMSKELAIEEKKLLEYEKHYLKVKDN